MPGLLCRFAMSVVNPEAVPLTLAEPTQAEREAPVFPPGDLYSNEPPLESDLHRDQINLLIQLLKSYWQNRQDFYVSGNLTVYYSPKQRKSEDFRGPDFFVVLNTERKPRKSWVVWEEEGKYPNLIIELLSDSTANIDRNLKKQIYQDTFRTPEYFWFDPVSLELAGFHLVDGQYEPIEPNQQGGLWSRQLQLSLGIRDQQLRLFTPEGELVPAPEETAQQEQQQRLEAEQRAAEAEALLAQYRERFGELG